MELLHLSYFMRRFRHWGGDTIAFSGTREKAVTTLVERKSRMGSLIKSDRKYSRGVMDKIKEKFESLPKKMCKTITFDQGSEFADYSIAYLPKNVNLYYQ